MNAYTNDFRAIAGYILGPEPCSLIRAICRVSGYKPIHGAAAPGAARFHDLCAQVCKACNFPRTHLEEAWALDDQPSDTLLIQTIAQILKCCAQLEHF
jgi:hypothetical protein